MLEAVAGRAAIDRSYEEALADRYLWHEFGDTHLICRRILITPRIAPATVGEDAAGGV